MLPNFDALLYGDNCLSNCSIRTKMKALQKTLVFLPENDKSTELVRTFISSYQFLYRTASDRTNISPDIALPALFDFFVSARYAARQIANDGWVYCSGDEGEQPSLFFPYLKTCPRCSVQKGIRPHVASNKPSSDPIGEIASEATLLILREVLYRIAPEVLIARSSDRQGDIDAVIFSQEHVALIEIKSSPLVAYPLEIQLPQRMSEIIEGNKVEKRDHTPATASLIEDEIYLYIPHMNLRIVVEYDGTPQSIFTSLITFLENPEHVALVIAAWRELYEVYLSKRSSKQDYRRFITFGCGYDVDDSKNAPGMDRTDDIKKGTYQALKIGVAYKEHCERRLISAVVASNLLPLHQFDRYLVELQDLIWTKEKYSVSAPANIRAFDSDHVYYMYDALIGLTRSIYHDDYLKQITSLDTFADRLLNG